MFDQLDEGIEALLAGAPAPSYEPAVQRVLAVAGELFTLPRPEFRAQLKAELEEAAMSSHALSRETQILRIPTSRSKAESGVPLTPLSLFSGSGYGVYPVQHRSFMASLAAHAAAIALVVTAGIWAAPKLDTKPLVSTHVVTDISPYPLHA